MSKNNCPPPPKVGDQIYVYKQRSAFNLGFNMGGLATVTQVLQKVRDNQTINWVRVKGRPFARDTYDWETNLGPQQAELKKAFGKIQDYHLKDAEDFEGLEDEEDD